jgi:hypothetical protein
MRRLAIDRGADRGLRQLADATVQTHNAIDLCDVTAPPHVACDGRRLGRSVAAMRKLVSVRAKRPVTRCARAKLRCSAPVVALAWVLGCASGSAAPAPAASMVEPPVPLPATQTLQPAPTPIDLLHAVPTTMTVSSWHVGIDFVEGDWERAIANLTDGDLRTAWRSRPNDLVGAYIEVTLPAGATVTGIEMTAGTSLEFRGTDYFTGSHRVAAVRVLHAGAQPVQHALDPDVRTLQPVPVTGGGGVYRIEVALVVAGTLSFSREITVSELRVLGVPDGETVPGITPLAGPCP